MTDRESLLIAETEALRAEAREAYEAWQDDLDNNDLERDYFAKVYEFDRVLEERGLERGEDLDEEVPLRDDRLHQSVHQSLDQGRGLDR